MRGAGEDDLIGVWDDKIGVWDDKIGMNVVAINPLSISNNINTKTIVDQDK